MNPNDNDTDNGNDAPKVDDKTAEKNGDPWFDTQKHKSHVSPETMIYFDAVNNGKRSHGK